MRDRNWPSINFIRHILLYPWKVCSQKAGIHMLPKILNFHPCINNIFERSLKYIPYRTMEIRARLDIPILCDRHKPFHANTAHVKPIPGR